MCCWRAEGAPIVVCDQVNQVDPVHQVNKVDEVHQVHQVDPVHQVNEIDEVHQVNQVHEVKNRNTKLLYFICYVYFFICII